MHGTIQLVLSMVWTPPHGPIDYQAETVADDGMDGSENGHSHVLREAAIDTSARCHRCIRLDCWQLLDSSRAFDLVIQRPLLQMPSWPSCSCLAWVFRSDRS